MTRRLTHDDFQKFMPLARRCYDEMDFDAWGYRFEPEQIAKTFILSVQGELIRGYGHGDLDGIMLFSLPRFTAFFANKPKVAEEFCFHADPDLRPLLKMRVMMEMLDFAVNDLKSIGVNSIYINSDVRFNGVSKMLQHKGFKQMSIAHYMEV